MYVRTYLLTYITTSLKSHRKSFMLITAYQNYVRVCTCICTLINIQF